MKKNLNWREIKKLHKLYEGESVNKGEKSNKKSFQNHPFIKFLNEKGYIKNKIGRADKFVKEELRDKFSQYYEEHFTNKQNVFHYQIYLEFLQSIGINTKTSVIKECDIKKLIEIKKFWSNEKLDYLRNQIINARENIQGVSKMFFKSSKYINTQSLEKAVKAVIGVDEFQDTDKQYLKPFHCKNENAKIAIICENFYFLKFPHHIEENEIELMYVGGNNVKRLKNITDINYPIYYLCDWDYEGLKIYERAKEIIDKLGNKEDELILLTPNGKAEKISETEEHHSSNWINKEKPICGLNKEYYSEEQQAKIHHLIINDEWIEEEGNELKEIINPILAKIKKIN